MISKVLLPLLITATLTTPVIAGTVDSAQRMLNQLGYNAGAVDGVYGKKTRAALEAFYADTGRSFDGKLDENEFADLKAVAIAAGVDVGDKNSVGGRMTGARTVAVPKMAFPAGRYYDPKFKVNGKYMMPIYANGAGHLNWAEMGNAESVDVLSLADFNGDGRQDFWANVSVNPDDFHNLDLDDQDGEIVGAAFTCQTASPKFMSCTNEHSEHYELILSGRDGKIDKPHWGVEKWKEKHLATHRLVKDSWEIKQNSGTPALVADFNGDGRPDVFVGSDINAQWGRNGEQMNDGGYASYFLSERNGTLVESSREMISGHEFDQKYGRLEDFMHRADAGDFDNDGDIDIIWASWDWTGSAGKSVCLWNDGTGRMTSKICADKGGFQVKHGDFNADGHIDMLIGDLSSECTKWAGGYKKLGKQSKEWGNTRILFGDGSRQWTYKRSSNIKSFGKLPSGAPICIIPTANVLDVDNDGDQDIVANTVGYHYIGEYFTVLENDGYGNFTTRQTLSVTGKEPPKSWRRINDFPKVEFGHDYGEGYCQRYLMVDFNEDGFIDIQCSTHDFKHKANLKIWMNLGDGTFRAATGQDTFPYITPF